MEKKTIVVFGATGTVGAYAAVELIKKYKVIAVGRRKSDNGFFRDYGIDYYSVNISEKNDFDKLTKENVDAVVHVAGMMPARMKDYNPHVYVDSEIHGTLNILEYMAEAKIGKIVYAHAGNNNVYKLGKIPVPPNIQKTFPPNSDHSVYSICKNAAVDLIEHYHYKFAMKRFILRLCNVYHYHPDPYYYVDGKKRWIGHRLIMEKAIRSMDIEIWGNPSKAKEAVYVYDCVSIIEKALESSLEGGVFNIAGVAPISLEEQIQGIVEVFCPTEKPSKISYLPDMPNDREFVADITKTRRELGYTPQWDYLQFLRDMKEKMEKKHFSKLWGTFNDYEDKELSI